ncbi:MAG: hypothetical protein Q8N26_37345 [Myxococcales bacterium]|nr:hypothetical protein [Myxococcales bacterium]
MPVRAPKIDWTPLVPGGDDLSTHRLVPFDGGLVMRKGRGTFVRAATGLLIGAPLLVIGVMAFTERPSYASAFTFAFGLVFAAVGVWFLTAKAVQFDERLRLVRIAGREVPFSTIAGLQVLPEMIEDDEAPTFRSWELNLVLEDGSRLNVVDHAEVEQLRAEAAQLSRLIDCPVWESDRR